MDWQGSVLSHFIATECEDLAHYSSFSPNKHLIHPADPTFFNRETSSNVQLMLLKTFSLHIYCFDIYSIFVERSTLAFRNIYSFFENDKWTSDVWNPCDSFPLRLYRNVKCILRCQTAINRQSPEPLSLVGKSWRLQIIKWRYFIWTVLFCQDKLCLSIQKLINLVLWHLCNKWIKFGFSPNVCFIGTIKVSLDLSNIHLWVYV